MTLAELIVKLGIDTGPLASGLKQTEGQLDAFGNKLESWGGAIAKALPFAALGGEALSLGIKFDEAMDRIRGATGKTGQVLDSLGQSLKNVYGQSEESLRGLTEALTLMHQRSGLTGQALEEITLKMSHLATLTGSQLQPMVEGLTRAFTAWGIETSKQAGAMDYLLKVYQASGVSVERILGTVTAFAPILKDVGIGFEDAAAMIAKFEKEGLNTETVLKGMQLGLRNFAKAGEEPVAAFQKLVEEIEKAGTVTEAHRLGIEKFGRSGIYMADAIRAGKLEVADFTKAIATSTETVASAREATLSFAEKWKILGHQMEEAILPLGESLLKIAETGMTALKPVVGLVADLAKQFAALPMPAQATVIALAGLQAIVPLLSKITAGIVGIQAGLSGVVKSAGLFGAAWAGQKLGEWLQSFTSDYKRAEAEVDKLAQVLRDQGLVVERGNLSLKDYAAKVFQMYDAMQLAAKAAPVLTTEINKNAAAANAAQKAAKELAAAYKTLGVTSFQNLVKESDAATAAYNKVLAAFQRGDAYVSDVEHAYAGMIAAQRKMIEGWADVGKLGGDYLSGFLTAGERATVTLAQMAFNVDATKAAWWGLTEAMEKFVSTFEPSLKKLAEIYPTVQPLIELTTKETMDSMEKIAEAYKSLGKESTEALQQRVQATKGYYDTIIGLEGAYTHNALLAERNYLQAVIEARRAAGEQITADEAARYKYLEDLLGKHKEKVLKFFDVLSGILRDVTREVSDAFGRLIVEGGNWAESMMSIVKKVAETIISTLVQGALNDLLHSFGLLTDKAWAAGDSLVRLFGGVADSATKAAKAAAAISVPTAAAGRAAGAAGGAVSAAIPQGLEEATGAVTPGATTITSSVAGAAAGGVASAVSGFMTGWVQPISAAVTAITDVLQYLQNRRMEKDIGRIEVTSREIKNICLSINDTLREFLPVLPDLHETLWKVYGYVAAIYDQAMAAITGRAQETVNAVASAGEAIADAVQEVVEELTPPGSTFDELASGVSHLTSATRNAEDALGDLANSVGEAGSQLGDLTNAFTDAASEVSEGFGTGQLQDLLQRWGYTPELVAASNEQHERALTAIRQWNEQHAREGITAVTPSTTKPGDAFQQWYQANKGQFVDAQDAFRKFQRQQDEASRAARQTPEYQAWAKRGVGQGIPEQFELVNGQVYAYGKPISELIGPTGFSELPPETLNAINKIQAQYNFDTELAAQQAREKQGVGPMAALPISTAREDLWLDPQRSWLTVQQANAERLREQIELTAQEMSSWARYPASEWPAGLQERIIGSSMPGGGARTFVINVTVNNADAQEIADTITRQIQNFGVR